MGFREYEMDHQYLIRMFRGMYDAQLEQMQESFARMDQLLSREIAREREMLEDEISTKRLEDWKILSEETYDMEGEEIVFGNARFRRLMRRSNLVTIITYFEFSLSEITSLLLSEANTRRVGTAPGLRLKDFRTNNACYTCHTALTRYIGISDNQSLWDSLKDFIRIRNKIVHQGGFISVIQERGRFVPEDDEFSKAHTRLESKGFSLLESGEMILEPELCQLLLEKVRDYLCDILDRASEHFTPPKAVKS